MRTVSADIWNLWDAGGPFVGADGAPHSRVTVEPDWMLNVANQAGNFSKLPVRWWQRADNSQEETEVPNIKSIQWERSLDSDAARCTITLYNQWHFTNGQANADEWDELGAPGYLTFSRGDAADAYARWRQLQNEYNGLLIPNALIRTYQGYGGRTKSVEDAVADGNIILTGVWLIDQVNLNTDGTITLNCRDMAKLLIDQFLFPPLVPDPYYPLAYCRFYFTRGSTPKIIYGDHSPNVLNRADSMRYLYSAGDDDGDNSAINGHHPTDALDQTTVTYWLSDARAAANEFVFYEVTVSEPINVVQWNAFWGGYQMYVSVKENGVWQGATIPGAPTGYETNYVFQTGVPFDGSGSTILDRVYNATNVRFTFTNLYRSDGTNYRAAMRELGVGRIESNLPTNRILGLAPAANDNGYWLVGNDGGVFALGPGATFYGSSGGGSTENQWAAIDSVSDGSGYWTVRADGRIFNYGSAAHFGDMRLVTLSSPAVDMQATSTDDGYWILGADGGVFAFGDASYMGRVTSTSLADVAVAFEARPQDDGYWILQINGEVTAFGSASHHGDGSNVTMVGTATGIASSSTGNGYWIVTTTGHVYAFGDATYQGGADVAGTLNGEATDIVRGTGAGANSYIVVAEDGGVFCFGTAFHGSLPGILTWEVKREGNYTDYVDIIKDLLLWSGWWLYDPATPGSSPPEVHGTLESTGIFNNTGDGCIPEDIFDKRPVIDAITTLKETVGFHFWIDEEGGARFGTPNWFLPGNIVQETGNHTTFVPIIDERTNLYGHQVTYTDAPVRSEIIISTADPRADLTDTITARLTVESLAEESAELLRGMVKPMMWVNDTFQSQEELDIMAERVATQILFNQRLGNITCAFNPAIQINDQVQVYERITSEVYVHYVRGVAMQHDIESGQMTMTLTTNWLGTGDDWLLDSWNLS